MMARHGTRGWTIMFVGLLVVSGLLPIATAQETGSETTAEISQSPQQPAPFEAVKFDASESTLPADSSARYVWTYETTDGIETAYGQSFVHTFEGVGSYDVKLTVEDSRGNVDTAQETVVPRSADPTAGFKTYPSNPGLNERVTFDPSPSKAPDLEIVEYQWFINGEPQRADRRLEATFTDPDLYTIGLKITDRAGKTDRISKTIPIGDKEAIYDNPAFELSRSAPEREVDVNPDETLLFATNIESEGVPEATQVFSVDGSVVSRSDVTSASVQSTYQFTQLGAHTVELKVEGVAGQTERVRWDVTTHPFNSAPSFSEQSSESTLDVDGNTGVLTFSVQNPDSNTQQLDTEILTKLPDGVSVSGASDVSSGDAAIQTASTTVPPGRQASMRLEVSVNDESLAGKRLIIPYQIRYHPKGNSDIIYTADEEEIEVLVSDGDIESGSGDSNGDDTESASTADSSPGFGVPAIAISWLGTAVLVARWRTNKR